MNTECYFSTPSQSGSICRYFDGQVLYNGLTSDVASAWQDRNIEDIKIAVMGHCFNALDYFNGKVL